MLKWMVNVNLYDMKRFFLEGSWNEAEEIQTEGFMLPALSSIEKEGSITNSGRVASGATRPLSRSEIPCRWQIIKIYFM